MATDETRKFKWGGEPLNVDQARADRAFGAVESAFSKRWLEKGSGHRLQQVWARIDFLAGLELLTLGNAIERLEPLIPEKLKELVSAVRRDPKSAHGHLYEILALSMIAAGSHDVFPTGKAAAGCDALVRFASGITMRVSLKNHDQSDHERAFRGRCERLYAELRAQAQPGTLERLFVIAERALEPGDFTHIRQHLRQVPRNLFTRVLPDVDLAVSRLTAPPEEQPFAHDSISAQATIVAAQHPSEQRNFLSKLRKAARNMAEHCPRQQDFANVLMMRLHATADVPGLQRLAAALLTEPDCALDAVLLHQPAVTRADGTWTIVQHVQAALGPNYPASCRLQLALPGALVSPSPSPVVMRVDDRQIELIDKYVFQKGEHVREARVEGNALTGHARAVADGIREDTVFSVHGQRFRIAGRHPPSDELLLI